MSDKKTRKYFSITLPDSGITLQYRKISPYTAIELRKRLMENSPQPPMQEVDYGNGKKVLEANYAHPGYLKAMQDFDSKFEEELRSYMIDQALVFEIEDYREMIDSEKKYFAGRNMALTATDREIFISQIAISSAEDLNLLMKEILGVSQPTQEAQNAAKATFRN
jgi:hypothetical protein